MFHRPVLISCFVSRIYADNYALVTHNNLYVEFRNKQNPFNTVIQMERLYPVSLLAASPHNLSDLLLRRYFFTYLRYASLCGWLIRMMCAGMSCDSRAPLQIIKGITHRCHWSDRSLSNPIWLGREVFFSWVFFTCNETNPGNMDTGLKTKNIKCFY